MNMAICHLKMKKHLPIIFLTVQTVVKRWRYIIILYGLEDDSEKRTENSRYSAYLDAFDFTGLVEQKLKDSEAKCLFLRQWTHFTRVRYIFVSTVMVLTALLLIIIKFF